MIFRLGRFGYLILNISRQTEFAHNALPNFCSRPPGPLPCSVLYRICFSAICSLVYRFLHARRDFVGIHSLPFTLRALFHRLRQRTMTAQKAFLVGIQYHHQKRPRVSPILPAISSPNQHIKQSLTQVLHNIQPALRCPHPNECTYSESILWLNIWSASCSAIRFVKVVTKTRSSASQRNCISSIKSSIRFKTRPSLYDRIQQTCRANDLLYIDPSR